MIPSFDQLAIDAAAVQQTGAVVPILSVTERAALLECEAIIREGRAVFVHVGQALSRIRDSRLYREGYSTFEDYCLAEWEISDRFARNLRSAADVVHVLQDKHFPTLPATESQARPLTKLPREEWAPAWEEVIGTAPNGRVTASHVAVVVQQRMFRLAGHLPTSDTEVFKRPTRAMIDAGTREQQITATIASARTELRKLQDLIRTADSAPAANLVLSLQNLDELEDNAKRVAQLQANRKADV